MTPLYYHYHVTTRSEMTVGEMCNKHCQLMQQSDHLGGMMTSHADKERALQNELEDKNTDVDNLHADNVLLKAELDDTKSSVRHQKLKTLSVKQEIAKIKDEDLAEQELISEQYDTIGRHSMELEQWQKECWELPKKTMHLNKDLTEKEGELGQEMSDLNNQLPQQPYLLSTGMVDKQKPCNILADGKRVDWRNVDKLDLDNEIVMEKLNDAEELIHQQQLEMQHLTMEEELSDEKTVESKCQVKANEDGASSVEYKENQNSLPKQHAGTTTLPQDGIKKVEGDDEEKIAESKCQIKVTNNQASTVEKIENQSSLPNQHAETTALPQEATNKVKRPARNKDNLTQRPSSIISNSCKEVRH